MNNELIIGHINTIESLPRKILYIRNIGNIKNISLDPKTISNKDDIVTSINIKTNKEQRNYYTMHALQYFFEPLSSNFSKDLMTCIEHIKNDEEKLFINTIENSSRNTIKTNNLLDSINNINKYFSMFSQSSIKPNTIIGQNVTSMKNEITEFDLYDNINIPENTYYLISNNMYNVEFVISQQPTLILTKSKFLKLMEYVCIEVHERNSIMKIIVENN